MLSWRLKCFWVYGHPLKKQELFLCSLILLTPALLFLVSNAFAKTIACRAAVVMDGSTGEVLYAKNPDRQLPPASTTKLMTAIVAIENKDLSDIVEISKHASHVSPTKAGFKEGDKVMIEGLLYAALLSSANDAAVALAESAAGSEERFVQLMNKKTMAIGVTNTRFINATGLPGPGQHTTASDLSKIMLYVLKYPKLKEIIGTSIMRVATEEGKTFFIKNTDKLLWSDEEIIGGKTGFTYTAGHCFVGAADRNTKTIIVSILGSPSRRALWKAAGILLQNVLR